MARGCFVIFSLAIFVLAPWANSQIILSDFESRMATIISENDFKLENYNSYSVLKTEMIA